MDGFGNRLKQLREAGTLTYARLAACTGIAEAVICKIEKGQRPATRSQVEKLASYFGVPRQQLITEWLSDKLARHLANEPDALQALQLAEEKIKYGTGK